MPKPEILSALVELEQKKFIQFRKELQSFLAGIRRLPRPQSRSDDAERDWFVATEPRGSTADNQFREEGYGLTDFGRHAADAIVKAVAAQLGQRPDLQ